MFFWIYCLTQTVHCGIHQTAPSKLGWGQPSFPYQITYTALPHTLSVSPSSLSSVSWACGMLLHCFGSGEQSAWWGCPSLTRRFQVQPEATDSRGWIWTIFLVLSPFQNSFLGFVSGLEQQRWSESQQGGRTSPLGRRKYLLGNGFKVGVLSAVVDVKWNIQWKKCCATVGHHMWKAVDILLSLFVTHFQIYEAEMWYMPV